jgi:GT2 family glycosyltransferase
MEEKQNNLVSIIIVTCGINDYLHSCLNSLRQQTHAMLEVIVVDNSINQDFSREISKHHSSIKLCSTSKNLFYSEALNRGIELSRGDFILCLNDDVILDSRFVEEALRGFFIDLKVGMVSGKILRGDGKTLDSTALILSPWRTAKERGYGLKDRGQFEKGEYIFGVNGAVAFYRREMLEDIKEENNYFDPDFHLFYEDLDVAWRAKHFGWRGYYTPLAVAYHVRGGTVRMRHGIGKPYARRFLKDEWHVDLIKNRYISIIKNESYLDFLLYLPYMVFYDFVMWSYILIFKPRLIRFFLLNLNYLRAAIKKRKFLKTRLKS